MKKTAATFLKNSFIGTLMIATTLAMALPPEVSAMLAPAGVSNTRPDISATRAADLKTIQTALESKMIRQRLHEFKLSPEQINQRLSQLSDAQIHQMATQIRTVNPGGGAIGLFIGLGVLVIIVLLIVWLVRRV